MKNLKPINRHITIIPHFKNKETSSGVLLPDTFSEGDTYIEATIVDAAADCSSIFTRRSESHVKIIVNKSMIEKVKVIDKTYYVILENYVMGVLQEWN